MTQDGVYWLFTSSAQTVAAFVAFLLAGFALVLSMLDQAAAKDETLVEIHDELKSQYYRRLRDLSELTAFSIVTDLVIVAIQGWQIQFRQWAVVGIGVLGNIAAILAAIWFILLVVDPRRIGKAARKLLNAERPTPGAATTPLAEFITVFIAIERQARSLGRVHDLAVAVSEERFLPLIQIVRALVRRQIIAPGLAERIESLARYRNLVVHGQIETIEDELLSEANLVLSDLSALTRREPTEA